MKKVKILLIALILIIGGLIATRSYALDYNIPIYAQLDRPFHNNEYQYEVPASPASVKYSVVKIYDKLTRDDGSVPTAKNSYPYYCLRGGVGFGDIDISHATTTTNYADIGEMHAQAEDIIADYRSLYNVDLNRTESMTVKSGATKDVNIYNAILWILDEAYIPNDIDLTIEGVHLTYSQAEYKEKLLAKAGIRTQADRDSLNEDDIEAIQQLAVWYFANYDEQKDGTTPTVSQASKYVAQHMYIGSLGNNFDNVKLRNMDKLYQYLVYGAMDNCDKYIVDEDTQERYREVEEYNEFDHDNSSLEVIDHNVTSRPGIPGIITNYYYMIGPIVIAGDSSKTVDSTNIVLYDNDGNPVSKWYEGPTGRDMIYEFYENNSDNITTDADGKVITRSSAVPSTQLKKGTGYYIKFYKIYEKQFNLAAYEEWLDDPDPYGFYAKFDYIPNGYNNPDGIDETYDLTKINIRLSSEFMESAVEYLEGGNQNQALAQIIKVKLTDEDWLEIVPPPPEKFYDLALRKFILTKNGEAVQSRVPTINTNTLRDGRINERGEIEYTATYTHSKTPISVKTGDKIVYTIRVYNEGDIDGKALEVKDYLPAGLKFVPASESSINRQYGWSVSADGKVLTTDYLKNTVIKAYDPAKTTQEAGWQRAERGLGGLYYADLKVECEVVANPGATEQTLRNIAEISQDDGDDRDSTPGNVTEPYNPPADNSTYQNDDDDYEPLVLEKGKFDLALRKFIIKAGDKDFNDANGNSREPDVSTDTIITGQPNQNGELEYTAIYSHPKNKVEVQTGDHVIYVIRVYNEGDLPGKATIVRDYLPDGLEFVEDSQINSAYGWTANGRVVATEFLSNKEIAAYDRENDNLHYEDLKIECKVVAEVGSTDKLLRNVAEITQDNGDDRDSTPGNVDVNNYTPEEYREFLSTYQEDDDDFEDLVLKAKKFDLALRKYITGVERNGQNITIENPRNLDNIDTSSLDEALNDANQYATAEYKHRKDPVNVEPGDVITYTFRVFNESETDGKVNAIIDYLPEGLDLDTTGLTSLESTDPNIEKWYKYEGDDGIDGNTHNLYTYYEFNKTTRKLTITRNHIWVGSAFDDDGHQSRHEENYIFKLNAYKKYDIDNTSELDFEGRGYINHLNYGQLSVRLKLTATYTEEDQILTNIATMKYSPIGANLTDGDSSQNVSPDETADDLKTTDIGYTGKEDNKEDLTDAEYHYKGEQDDDDFEKVIIKGKEFDLALRKFISKVERKNRDTNNYEVIEIASREPSVDLTELKEGTKTTARYVHPKNKLSLKRGDIITYTIRVYNESELDGYVTEVKDYLPEGLELVEGRNEGWTIDGNTLTNTTLNDQLLTAYNKDDNTGLYYRDLQVVCKIKDSVTDGATLVNIAEISGDKSVPTDIDDRDSTPGNFPDGDKNNDYNGNGEDNGYYPGKEDDDDFEPITIEPDEVFDLALRKYITNVERNGQNITIANERDLNNIDTSRLNNGSTTADYYHRKDAVEVEPGDIVTYRLATYNEGQIAGYVISITDFLPKYLDFVPTDGFISEDEVNQYDQFREKSELTAEEQVIKNKVEAAKYIYKYDEENRPDGKRFITIKKANYTTDTVPGNVDALWLLQPYDGRTLDSKYVEVKFKVNENAVSQEDKYLTNIATMEYAAERHALPDDSIQDRDSDGRTISIPDQDVLVSENETAYKGNESNKDQLDDTRYHYKGQEDDDDFEKLFIKGKNFDLALRKYIASIKRGGKDVAFDSREPKIDTTTLINGTYERNGELEYTATYEHSKDSLVVKKGDIVTYTLRIYNEGEIDGYAAEITDYIPEGLALIQNYKTNYNNGWKIDESVDNSHIINLIGENGFNKSEESAVNFDLNDFEGIESLSEVQLVTGNVSIKTTELDDELIKAFDQDKTSEETGWQKAEKGEGGLYYKDIQVTCLVIAENSYKDIITNNAEISIDKDENGNEVVDRDSTPDNITDRNEDDNDYEPIILRNFDLALRKFITNINSLGKSTDVTSRIPEVKIGEDGNITYVHPKDPIYVANNDLVTYTIRVYNEGTIDGYAEEVADDLPEGLLFLADNETNKEYGWVMLDEEGKVTDDVEKAVRVTTDYLSSAKERTEGRDNLLKAFDSSKAISSEEPYNPDYRDVKIVFQIIEPNTSDRILVNSAQITEDSGDDDDSIPGEWNEGEDDQDKEYVNVRYFDLSLLKWVTQSIVTVDGKTTTTDTGFMPNTGLTETTGIRDNNAAEPIAKVELDRKKLDKTTVKFVYKIRVTNEGTLAGYATEVTDFIPDGLEFNEEDNKAYGWTKKGDTKVVTRALETTLLNPGESAELTIVFRWKNSSNNLGLKTNIAEITEDYNEYDSNDIDSKPNDISEPYQKEQEDDDDFALVILSLKTGKEVEYTLFIISIISVLTTGIYLVKRYVLD